MKRTIQKLKSSKLYYNKWPYKIECYYRRASVLIRVGIGNLKLSITSSEKTVWSTWLNTHCTETTQTHAQVLEFITAIEPFLKNKNVKTRIEHNTISIFCKELAMVEELDTKLDKWIHQIQGPTTVEEYNFQMENGHKTILRDQLPKGKYQYKLYFSNKWPLDKRKDFITWSINYSEQIHINRSSKNWFNGYRHDNPCIYVQDEKLLSIVGLFAGGNIKKIEKFVLRENALLA